MNEDERRIAETLAGIAGQGGADKELDIYIYEPTQDVNVGGLHDLGEGINPKPVE